MKLGFGGETGGLWSDIEVWRVKLGVERIKLGFGGVKLEFGSETAVVGEVKL